jgi:hypothetical protein
MSHVQDDAAPPIQHAFSIESDHSSQRGHICTGTYAALSNIPQNQLGRLRTAACIYKVNQSQDLPARWCDWAGGAQRHASTKCPGLHAGGVNAVVQAAVVLHPEQQAAICSQRSHMQVTHVPSHNARPCLLATAAQYTYRQSM